MTKPAQSKRNILTYISRRRICTTCIRQWCESMRPPDEKEKGCLLWRDKGEGGDV